MISPLAAHGHAFWSALSAWDWVQFAIEGIVFVWVLWLAIKWTLKPGEEEPDHVKRSILDDDRDAFSVSFPAAAPFPAGPSGREAPARSGPSVQAPAPPKA